MLRRNSRAKLRLGVTTAGAVGLVVLGVAPANAASLGTGCGAGATKTTTSTSAYMSSCQSVQARIDRYSNGVVRIYTGPQGQQSYVSSREGYHAGNAGRALVAGPGPYKTWTDWKFI